MFQRVDGLLIMVKDGARRRRCGIGDGLRCHVRVAVVVAADPRTGAHDRRAWHAVAVLLLHVLVDTAVDRGDFAQQADAVVAQTHFDLVFDTRAHTADQGGLPQQRHPTTDHQLDLLQLARRTDRLRVKFKFFEHACAPTHHLHDVGLHVEHGPAAGFRRVRRQHWCYQGVRHGLGDLLPRHRMVVQFLPGVGQRGARRGVAAVLFEVPHALDVQILGQVRHQREVRERADDWQRLVRWQRIELFRQLFDLHLAIAQVECRTAGVFNQVEGVLALLLPNHLAQDTTEVTGIVPHRRTDLWVGNFFGSDGNGRAADRVLAHRRALKRLP